MKLIKFTFLLFLICAINQFAFAQVLPDILADSASASHYYYENRGQLIDDSGAVRNDILYYTERTQPAVYLANDKASFVVSRIDTASTDTN